VAYTQAFGQAANGRGDMAGLFIPAPDGTADRQQAKVSANPVSPDPNSSLEWKDGMSGLAPKPSPSSAFLWAASSGPLQGQTPNVANQFMQAAGPASAQPSVDPAVLAEALNKITVALDSAPPPAINAYSPATAATDINRIDRNTTAHAENAAQGHAAVQDIQAIVAKASAAPSASGAFSAAAGAPAPGPAVQASMAGFDAARMGAGSFGAQGHTSAYADNNGGGYSGASAAAPPASAAPQQPVSLPGLNHPGRATLAGDAGLVGDSLRGITSLRVDGMDMKQLAAKMGAMNYDARQMKDTMNKIANQGVPVGSGEAIKLASQGLNGSVSLNDNGTGGTAFQLSRGRASAPGGMA
jgi:hypothetical protein